MTSGYLNCDGSGFFRTRILRIKISFKADQDFLKVSDQGFFQEPVEMRENLWYNKSYVLKDRGGSYNEDNQD